MSKKQKLNGTLTVKTRSAALTGGTRRIIEFLLRGIWGAKQIRPSLFIRLRLTGLSEHGTKLSNQMKNRQYQLVTGKQVLVTRSFKNTIVVQVGVLTPKSRFITPSKLFLNEGRGRPDESSANSTLRERNGFEVPVIVVLGFCSNGISTVRNWVKGRVTY